ncbi:MAG: hypothetical protein P4L83_22975 [Nevskia sp.]|nr:hypothetical protein [Nevskia sp.]
MNPGRLQLDQTLLAWLPRADDGDHVAMAYMAIVRFLTDGAGDAASRDYCNNWLRRAMTCDDAEFLIAMAEQLVVGAAIYRDLRLARDFLSRALMLSEMKGSYAMARFLIVQDRKRSLAHLKRAAQLGHIPSRELFMALSMPEKRLHRRTHTVRHLPLLVLAAARTSGTTTLRDRWWRHRDVITEVSRNLHIPHGEDRPRYFTWSRPSSIDAFAEVLKHEKTRDFPRGPISLYALQPAIVDEALQRSRFPVAGVLG